MTTLETATKNYREKGEIEMKITPDEAQKLIHSLEEDRRQLVDKMKKLVTFVPLRSFRMKRLQWMKH